ncbi:MAG: efflux RND transporter permease subunit [Bacteroidota bacterium]
MKDLFKEFKPTSWSINNKTSIYVVVAFLSIFGIMSYNSLPKEQFPEVVFPQIYVATVYPGTSPTDMENLVTKQIEKKVKGISGVKKITSNSIQDFSNVIVEFNTDVDISEAKRLVKEKVDEARNDLPENLLDDPQVIEIDVSQIPIMNVNLYGDYDLEQLKEYAEDLQDKIEGLKEITRVDIVGALDREIQIDVDLYKMAASRISMGDIENAVAYENMAISGGQIAMGGLKRSLSVNGDFKNIQQVQDIIVRAGSGATVYLKDIAEVKDGFEEQESFARLDHKNVITLNVIKRSGENLIEASDKIQEIVGEMQKTEFPKGLNVSITGDQSDETRVTLNDLNNTIVIGFALVTIILMFFMGTTNALFVALSVPLSMFIAFMVLPGIGFTLNMIVLFSFLLALGIVVDDAIVVIENTHRVYHENPGISIVKAAKMAAGEVFMPVLSGTLTTLAPFVPLAFWQGVIGKFMFYLPVTLIITLLASLVVAYIINPVFAVDFMEKPEEKDERKRNRAFRVTTIIFGIIALLLYISGFVGGGNFALFIYLLYVLNKFVFVHWIHSFQTRIWPNFQERYKRLITWCLKGRRPVWLLLSTLGLLIISFIATGIRQPKVEFFPKGEPNFVMTYITLPVGTDQVYTDSISKVVEKKIYSVIGEKNPIVKSVITNVAVGANEDPTQGTQAMPEKGKISVAFVKFADRNGVSTKEYLDKIREAIKGIPGAEITVDQEQGGPPTGKPVNIEISGDVMEDLIKTSVDLKNFIDKDGIAGIEQLKSDIQASKPEVRINIDREKASREGISTAQIGSAVRTAVFGKEISKFKDDNDDYPIQLRLSKEQRNNIDEVMNQPITFRDMNMGGILRSIPLSSVASIEYTNSYGGIKRINQKRTITLSSNVLSGYTANEIVAKIEKLLPSFPKAEGVTIKMTGEQEEQAETGAFLARALMIAFGLIFLILVTQFNSVGIAIIILSEVLFSLIGVLLGFSIFNMSFVIVMSGVGIVALAGIVVRNGILLIEFTEILLKQGMELEEAIIEAGKTRMTPVLLTASATILGLVPLAIGFNIDFVGLFSHFQPHFHLGGDSVAFWGPLSWTMIFGLSFATFLTLILVPVMFLLYARIKLKWKGKILNLPQE